MYSEPFQFEFANEVKDSERMNYLSDMFRLSETSEIDPINYCGYKVEQSGVVKFSSSCPKLTSLVSVWVQQHQESGLLKVKKPSYLKNA